MSTRFPSFAGKKKSDSASETSLRQVQPTPAPAPAECETAEPKDQPDVHDAYPLTAPGGEFHVDDALRQMLCYLSDERLLISKSHAFNPHVRGFQARLTHLGRQFRPLMVDLATIEQAYAGTAHGKAAASSSDMQKAAKGMFDRAVDQRASDIHIRVSKREKTKIYFRVHNDLEYKEEHPYDWGAQLCTAIYQAMADVADSTFEPLSRQDARISERAKLPARLDGIRIATTPQVDGFVMVLRLLYNDTTDSVDVGELGHGLQQKNAIEFMKRRPTGINIISGPTGSGKSTTLQRVLGGIIRECQGRLNVITVEDPPEYPIPGAVQTPVTNAATEEERSRAFQEAIKSAMRLDPDVIMIGEIRDTPSARLAIQAAMTGHQVWTTVHANGAFAIIDRLIDLGVPIELVCDPSIVTGLVCQRLVKVLCPECKVHITKVLDRYHQSDVQRIMAVLELDKVYVRGDGCPHCRNSGTIGRTVISETIVTDHKLLSLVRAHDRMSAIEYWKRDQSGITMLEDAITKIQAGRVDPFQAEAVVGPLTMGLIERDMRIEAREVVSAL